MTRLYGALFCRATFVQICVLSIFQVQSVITEVNERVSIVETDQMKRIGDEVEFNCKINDLKDESLLWMKINKNNRFEQFFIAMNTTSILKDRFSVKYDEENSTYSLRILRLEAADTGLYQCQMLLGANNKITADVNLDIERAPEITVKSPSTVSILEGESTDLQCQAEGFPVPTITWMRENSYILPMGNTWLRANVLSVRNATKSDRGIYICIAKNTLEPVDKAEFKLNVEFAPVVDTPRPRIGQARGYDAKLRCRIEANPTPSVTWLKGGKVVATEIPRASTEEFVHMHQVSVIDLSDYGRYTCRAKNRYGEAEAVVELFNTDFPWINGMD